MVQLNCEPIGMSLPAAVAGAIDIVRARRAFALWGNDLLATLDHLRRYYAKVHRANSSLSSADTLTRLEWRTGSSIGG